MSAASRPEAQRKASLMSSFLILEILLFHHVCQSGAESQDWSYNGCLGDGPSNWVKNYPNCGRRFESPVDISHALNNGHLKAVDFEGYDTCLKNPVIVNNGNSAQVSSSNSTASITGGCLGTDTYDFAQFHFHWGSDDSLGSEHSVRRRRYPMEGHIVHINRKYGNMSEAVKHPDGIAVLAIFYQSTRVAGASMRPVIEAVKEVSQKKIDEENNVEESLTLRNILPRDTSAFYCYRNGSLTTPGCFESVTWTIFRNPVPLSKAQIAEFRKLRFRDGTPMVNNFRPQQKLNGRKIYSHKTC